MSIFFLVQIRYFLQSELYKLCQERADCVQQILFNKQAVLQGTYTLVRWRSKADICSWKTVCYDWGLKQLLVQSACHVTKGCMLLTLFLCYCLAPLLTIIKGRWIGINSSKLNGVNGLKNHYLLTAFNHCRVNQRRRLKLTRCTNWNIKKGILVFRNTYFTSSHLTPHHLISLDNVFNW